MNLRLSNLTLAITAAALVLSKAALATDELVTHAEYQNAQDGQQIITPVSGKDDRSPGQNPGEGSGINRSVDSRFQNPMSTDSEGFQPGQIVRAQSAVAAECGLNGDVNLDGIVNELDLSLLLLSFGTASAFDLSADGGVDGTDIGVLLSRWGETCEVLD